MQSLYNVNASLVHAIKHLYDKSTMQMNDSTGEQARLHSLRDRGSVVDSTLDY